MVWLALFVFLQLLSSVPLAHGSLLLNRFTKTIQIFSFEFDGNEKIESCFFVDNQMPGSLKEFSLSLRSEENINLGIDMGIHSDQGYCIFYSSFGGLQQINHPSCLVSNRKSFKFGSHDFSQHTFQDFLETDLFFARSFEICVSSSPSPQIIGQISGEFTLHLQHLLLEFPKLTLASSFLSSETSLLHDSALSSNAEFTSSHSTAISSQPFLSSSDNSSLFTISVNYLLDTLPNISSCVPSSSSSVNCNLRSALAFCNHTLSSADTNLTCVIALPPSSQIFLNSSFGALKVDANSGDLQIFGNGCEILPLERSYFLRFLEVSPRSSPSLSFRFRFENCTISKFGNSLSSGGALSIHHLDFLSLRGLNFISNEGLNGGGLSLNNIIFVELEDCLFWNNSAEKSGGGMFVNNVRIGGVTILRSQFHENKAMNLGGGISWNKNNSKITIVDCEFHDNIITNAGEGAGRGGGGMAFSDSNSEISITNTNFFRNIGTSGLTLGGAVFFGIACSNVVIRGGYFDGNKAGFGGVFMFDDISNAIIEDTTFTHSSTINDASVMQIGGSNVTIKDCLFSNNQKSTINKSVQEIYLFNTVDITFQNCSFQNNSKFIDAANDNQMLRVLDSNFTSNGMRSLSAISLDSSLTGIIEGCIFSNGSTASGGALKLSLTNGSLLISNCEFIGNEADSGGAVTTSSSLAVVEFTNCLFKNNKATHGSGGAIYIGDEATLTSFHDCQFIRNEASEAGGAIFMLSHGTLVVNTSNFIENQALKLGGGAIYADSQNTITILSCLVIKNQANNGGGGMEFGYDHLSITLHDTSFISNEARIYGIGGLHIISKNKNIHILNCLFLRNIGSTSGGCVLGTDNLNVEFRNTHFMNNIAEYEGGGLMIDSFNTYLNLYDCIFENNTADLGAGISIGVENSLIFLFDCSFVNNIARSEGGGIALLSWNGIIISNSIFLENHGTQGGGLYIYSNNVVSLLHLQIINNTASDNGGGVYLAFQNRNNYYEKLSFSSNSAIDGGGLYLQSGNENLLIRYSNFTKNNALQHGGGMFIQDSNVGVIVEFCVFEENMASLYGGGIMLQSANYEFLIFSSRFQRNSAISAGGTIHSSLFNENFTIMKSEIFDSSAEYGGSVYIGNDHHRILLDQVIISHSSAGNVGGGLFVSPFNDQLEIVNCSFLECFSLQEGAAIYSYADVNTLIATEISGSRSSVLAGVWINGRRTYVSQSIFRNNYATDVDATGCLTVTDGDLLQINRTQFLSSGSYHGGGLSAFLVDDLQISASDFFNLTGSVGGAVVVEESASVEITSTNFLRNSGGVGAAVIMTSVQSLLLNESNFFFNLGDYYGGAMILSETTGTLLNSSFINNTAARGDGAALYIDSSSISLLSNRFIHNSADLGGGTVFWISYSMYEPFGFLDPNLNQFALNSASYGANWATEGSQLSPSPLEIEITQYGVPIPHVLVSLLDEYNQLVNTHSSFVIRAFVSTSQICDTFPGYVTGEISEIGSRGIANFSSLQVYCAPGFSLSLQFQGFIYDNVFISTSITLSFRHCVRGEYYSAQECIPCEFGTYSLSDDNSDLSQMNQISVCRPCPAHTISCEAAELVLEKGYWRISVDSDSIQACPFGESACLGGTTAGDDSCAVGYEGPLCAVCSSGYALQSSTKTCVPCSDASSGLDVSDIILFSVIAVLVICCIYYFTRPEIRSQIKSMDDFVLFVLTKLKFVEITDATNRKEILLFTKTLSRRLRARLKVYVTMYQILSVLPFVLDLAFPSPVTVIISGLNFINLSISGSTMVSCTAQSYNFIDSLLFDTIYPIVVSSLIFAVRWIHIQVLRFRHRRKASDPEGSEGPDDCQGEKGEKPENLPIASRSIENHISNVSSTYFSIFLIFTYLILPSVVTKIFQTFR
jgi:predicted outer membrane repeat protein